MRVSKGTDKAHRLHSDTGACRSKRKQTEETKERRQSRLSFKTGAEINYEKTYVPITMLAN